MEPWYKIATPRPEVRDERSFDPNEFAIALEQVVGGKGPADYRDPEKFFARTSFTRALREHTGMALRRLAGETQNTPPVLTLITQFGGGKTHTLTALYHLAKNGKKVAGDPDIQRLLAEAGLSKIPSAEVAVFTTPGIPNPVARHRGLTSHDSLQATAVSMHSDSRRKQPRQERRRSER